MGSLKLNILTNSMTILGERIENELSDSDMIKLYEDTLETVHAIHVALKDQYDVLDKR